MFHPRSERSLSSMIVSWLLVSLRSSATEFVIMITCAPPLSIGSENWKLTQTAAKTFLVAIFWVNKKYCGKSHRNCPLGPDLQASYWLWMSVQPYHWLPVSNNPSLRNARRVFLARCYITQSFRVIALEIHTSISFYSPQGLGRGHSLPLTARSHAI